MSEIRYREVVTYSEGLSAEERVIGNATITQEPYEVSDEELFFEKIEKDSNDGIHAIRENLENWDSLSKDKKRDSIKDIYTCLLNLCQDRF